MATIQKIKERKQQETNNANANNKPTKKTNNWAGFASSLGMNILKLIILTILGGNVIYIIRSMGTEKYLPTNLQQKPYNLQGVSSLFKAFPYKKITNPKTMEENIQNWFAETIQYSWVTNRGIFQELFNGLQESTNIEFPSMENVQRRVKLEKWMKIAMDSLFFLFSPLLLMMMAFLAGTIGFVSTIVGGFKSADGFFHKIFGLFGGYSLAYIISFIQFLWAFVFIVFKPFTVNIEHIFKTIKEFKGLLLFLFIVFVLSSSMQYLSQGINIGLIVGLVILFGGTVVSYLFL